MRSIEPPDAAAQETLDYYISEVRHIEAQKKAIEKRIAQHAHVSERLGAEFYFALPHHPWERRTNENTNGLLREYFPKGEPLDDVSDAEVQATFAKLNRRPHKRHGYLTPYEVFYSEPLHLV